MAVLQRLSDGEIEALANRVLGPEMADLGFAGVAVDHRDLSGDGPSLHIGAKVGGDVPAPFDPGGSPRIFQSLHDAVLDQGDDGFPRLVVKREGDEQPEPDHIPVDP